jgi:hypothetical protein
MRSAEQLVAFLAETMSMTDIYQPAVILHLLERGGTASKQDLARTLSGYDQSVQEYYEKVLMRWPKATLTKHGVVSYDRRERAFTLAFDLTDEVAVTEAKRICERKIAEWIQKKAERDPSGGVDASTRYRVLKAAHGRCELCGISSKLSPIDIDHIVPRKHAEVVIGTTVGSAIGIRKGNTVAQPLRVALMPPQGDEDAHGGPVRAHSAAPPRRADHPADRRPAQPLAQDHPQGEVQARPAGADLRRLLSARRHW